MKISRYLRQRERNGWTAIFHELHPDPFYLPTPQWNTFVDNSLTDSVITDELVKRKLIITENADDEADFQITLKKVNDALSRPKILYLMLARGCNFNCGYCPVPRIAATYGEASLSVEDMTAGLTLWSRTLTTSYSRESTIIFYGGEPLLNKNTFFTALDTIKQMQDDVRLPKDGLRLMIATNGTLIDEAVIDACKEHDILVAVGLDGPKKANDLLRVYANGNGSFDDICIILKRLQKAGIRTAVSSTMTPHNVKCLVELENILREHGVVKFGLNLPKGGFADNHDALYPEFPASAIKAMMTRYRNGCDEHYEYQTEKKIESFRNREFYPVDCTCYGNQIVIMPDGNIANCPFTEQTLGHIQSVSDDFRISETDTVISWRMRLPLIHSAHKDNEAKSLCGPGCAWGALDRTGDVLSPDDVLMNFSQEIFEDLIWSEFRGEKNER